MSKDNNKKKIIFVYNADGGMINTIKDFWKKILSPSAYDCQLCMVSWGNFSMKKDWKEYVENLKYPVEFLHRDEFYKEFPENKEEFPCALILQDGNLDLLINKDEMNAVKNSEELIQLTNEKIKNI
jgi:hypothetical protein